MTQPSQAQLAGQLRAIIPVLGTLVTVFGYTTDEANTIIQFALEMVGPISFLVTAVWSWYAHSRQAIITQAALPAAPGLPAPVIVLPLQEEAIADKLPNNVVAVAVPSAALKAA